MVSNYEQAQFYSTAIKNAKFSAMKEGNEQRPHFGFSTCNSGDRITRLVYEIGFKYEKKFTAFAVRFTSFYCESK